MTQKFFEAIPSGTTFSFVKNQRRFLLFSMILMVLSISALGYNLATRDAVLNFGIDFQGGSQVRVEFVEAPDIEAVRETLKNYASDDDDPRYEGSSAVAVPDAERELLIRVKETVSISTQTINACESAVADVNGVTLLDGGFARPQGSSKIFLNYSAKPDYAEVEKRLNEAGCEGEADPGVGKEGEFPVDFTLVAVGSRMMNDLNAALGEGSVLRIVSSETVGPKVGARLKVDGALSMVYALGFIFLFVMVRFDLRFAPGGIVALTHDSIIVTGMFALFWKEFNLQTIAALLTIIGYSINDTIVVFDRIRERVALDRDAPIEETTNRALNETLSRTVLTSGTTLLVVLSTWVLGSGPIKDFAFALFIGVIVGTYSSLFVASPVFLWVNNRFYKGKGHLLAGSEEQEGTGTIFANAGQRPDGSPAPSSTASPTDDDDDTPTTSTGEKKTRRRRRRPQG